MRLVVYGRGKLWIGSLRFSIHQGLHNLARCDASRLPYTFPLYIRIHETVVTDTLVIQFTSCNVNRMKQIR